MNSITEFEREHSGKAMEMATKFKKKLKWLHKIEFHAKGKYHAVLLTDRQLNTVKVKANGMPLKDYYIEKYSV